ncbi:MAG: MarR family transcriptional regulator [Chloroflexi bacterium]|nr:MarR family transcriptional regulator [Chloroflexota bacterium]
MGRIEDCFIFQLGKAYQQVNQEAKRRLAPYGVTPVQYGLLEVLWEMDGQSGAALGGRLRLDGATVTGLLDRLAHAGLVERRPHPTDRRINHVYLTKRGRALQQDLDREIDTLAADVLGRLLPAGAERFQEILTRMGHIEAETGAPA